MKILKKSVNKTYITGVTLSGKELFDLMGDNEIRLELPIEDGEYYTAPTYDKWEATGDITITFLNNHEDLPEYIAPSSFTKKAMKKK